MVLIIVMERRSYIFAEGGKLEEVRGEGTKVRQRQRLDHKACNVTIWNLLTAI